MYFSCISCFICNVKLLVEVYPRVVFAQIHLHSNYRFFCVGYRFLSYESKPSRVLGNQQMHNLITPRMAKI